MKTGGLISVFRGVVAGGILLVFLCLEASALEVAGVDVPQSVMIGNKVLVLNGAGIRRKFFIKVYVGALYLPVKQSSASKILAETGARRIVMHFLYKEVSKEKLVDGWNEGFENNSSAEELKSLQERIDRFNSLFSSVRKGDEIRLDYIPGEGTRVWINGTTKGTVEGEDFSRALLKIWLGEEPADDDLKKAWIGK